MTWILPIMPMHITRTGKLIFCAGTSRGAGYKARPVLVALNQPEITVIADSFPGPQTHTQYNPTEHRRKQPQY